MLLGVKERALEGLCGGVEIACQHECLTKVCERHLLKSSVPCRLEHPLVFGDRVGIAAVLDGEDGEVKGDEIGVVARVIGAKGEELVAEPLSP